MNQREGMVGQRSPAIQDDMQAAQPPLQREQHAGQGGNGGHTVKAAPAPAHAARCREVRYG